MSGPRRLCSLFVLSFFMVTVPAAAGEITLLSTIDPGRVSDTNGNTVGQFGPPNLAYAMSGDGRYVAFESDANHIVPGQVEQIYWTRTRDVFVYDRTTGTRTLVSRKAGTMTTASEGSFLEGISPDGRWIAFNGSADELATGDPVSGLFLFDLTTGVTARVTTEALSSGSVSFSTDGRYLVFQSNVDAVIPGQTETNEHSTDVFLYDRVAASLTLVSHASGASSTTGNADSSAARISADGGAVVFSSAATNLVAGMTLPAGGSGNNIFLYDRASGAITLVSHAAGAPLLAGDAGSANASISDDGTRVAFDGYSTNLVAGDGNGAADVFLWDRAANTVSAVSRPAGGTGTADGGSSFPLLSADGRYVAYTSGAGNLIAGMTDSNFDAEDVFVYDRVAGTTALVSRAAGSAASTGDGDSFPTAITPDGRFVAFLSGARNLLPGFDDRNTSGGDLFVHDRDTGTTTLASHAAGLPAATGNSSSWQALGSGNLSADGRFAAFISAAADLAAGFRDLNGDLDILLFDRTTGDTVIASATEAPSHTAGRSTHGAVSADGRYTAFVSTASLLPPSTPVTGPSDQIFLYDRTSGARTLVSRSRDAPGTPADGGSEAPVLSADGRFVAFVSAATNLVSGVSDNSTKDVFVYDRISGAMALASRSKATAGGGNRNSTAPVISSDGRWVAFQSEAGDLVAGVSDSNFGDDVFLYDRATGVTTLISQSAGSPGTTGNGVSYDPVISVDGRFVAFGSNAWNLVPGQSAPDGPGGNVYLYDRLTGTMTLVSRSAASPTAPGDNGSGGPALSGDGRFVAYLSSASNLVPGQNGSGYPIPNVFLYDRISGTNVVVSHSSTSPTGVGNSSSGLPTLSADGRYVAFASDASNLVAGQTYSGDDQIFLYDAKDGSVRLVSHAAGSPLMPGKGEAVGPALSGDGRFLTYSSFASNLLAGETDSPSFNDVFLFDQVTGTTVLVSGVAGSSTAAMGPSYQASISADGSTIGFTGGDIVPHDLNSDGDAYLYVNPLPGRDFFTVPPCRLIDTRQPGQGPALASGAAEVWAVPGFCGIPPTARAISVNVTVTQPTGVGHLSFAPGDFGTPQSSTINFGPGQTRANNAILPLALNSLGTLRVSANVAGGGTVHVLVDVNGYFE